MVMNKNNHYKNKIEKVKNLIIMEHKDIFSLF